MVIVIPLPEKKTIKKLIKRAARIGLTLSIMAVPQMAWASGLEGLNAKASTVYYTLASVGKWLIILKGSVDAIQLTAAGDFNSLKKNILGYLGMFAILLSFPWAMTWVEETFNEMLIEEGVLEAAPITTKKGGL